MAPMSNRFARTPSIRRVVSIITIAAALVVPAVMDAQSSPDTTTLDAAVITATRLPGAIRSQTATVTVLDGAALRAEGVTHLADALRRVPGAAVVGSGSFGSQGSLFLRGGQSNYVRVLVDGVVANDPGGALDLARLTLDDVERIEVVRGPVSVVYGSEAVTAVIQLFTRSGGPRAVRAEVGGGSYGALRSSLGASGGGARLRWSVQGDQHRSDGILPFNNAYRNEGVSAALGVAPDAATDLRLTARYNTSDYQYPTNSSGTIEDRNAHSTQHRLMLGVDAGRRWNDRTETRVQLTASEFLPRSTDRADDAGDTLGFYGYTSRATVTRRAADLRTNVRLFAAQRLTVGAELARDHENGTSLSESEFGDFPGAFTAGRTNRAAYAQLLGDRGRFSYTLGGRFDDNSAFGTFRTARVGVAVRVTDALTLRASAGNAFKAPTFFENFAEGFTVGNPDLAPERSRSAEIGAEARGRGAVLRVTLFTQRFEDLVQYDGAAAPGEPNFRNIAAANAGGVELEASLPEIHGFVLSGSHAWTDTRVVRAGFDPSASATFVEGGRLIRRPTHLSTVQLGRPLGAAGTLGLALTRVGAREDRDFSGFPATPVMLDPHTRVDLSAELRVPERWLAGARVLLRAENVLAARYQEIVGFDAPGRSLYAGLKLER